MKGFGDACFAIVSVTGIFEYIQRKFKAPLQNTNVEQRKKALDDLDEEIKGLTAKKEDGSSEGSGSS
eukprot:CAMPEP_0170543984 /NCGR_PEP_ID=MMETSP0211-20121228/2914_1 /TAXON_ID=311385 /ORGANISM="Pseudokeronopsis sp., Strain OXSARD2" /LENGTH=66 /DNA_ID=CAMNT_0010847517 /DNA_START=915 /DNA_END=1115 /DNA_ORIENTATION=-